MNKGFLKYLATNKDTELCNQIFNSSTDTLPHRLEILKSEKQKNRHEIKQVFTENIHDYLDSHEITVKLKNEMHKLQATSKNISTSLAGALRKISHLKSQVKETQDINNKINLYKSYHQNDFMNIFEIEDKIKMCVRFELFQEAHDLFMWYSKLINSRKDKNYEVFKYLRHHLQTLKLNIFEYMLLNLKKTKFQRIANIIKDLIQNGEYHIEKLIPVLFPLYLNFSVKHKIEKAQKKSQSDPLPGILASYPKAFDKAIRLLEESLGDKKSLLIDEHNTRLILREYYKYEKIMKFLFKGSDETLIIRFGPEYTDLNPRCIFNFKDLIANKLAKFRAKQNLKLKRKLEVLFRYLECQSSFEKFLTLDEKCILPAEKDESKSKLVQAAEYISKILKEKRGTEILHILIVNYQAYFSYYYAFSHIDHREKTREDYEKLREVIIKLLKDYFAQRNVDYGEKYLTKFNELEPFIFESLVVCSST